MISLYKSTAVSSIKIMEGNFDDGNLEELGIWARLVAVSGIVQEHWLGSFLLNLLGYALIIIPAAYLIRRWKNDPDVKAGK